MKTVTTKSKAVYRVYPDGVVIRVAGGAIPTPDGKALALTFGYTVGPPGRIEVGRPFSWTYRKRDGTIYRTTPVTEVTEHVR